MIELELSPARQLEIAVTLLAVLARQTQKGGAVSQDLLAEVIPLDARDLMMEALRANGYLIHTAEDSVSLARDLSRTTVADLARDLNLALGLHESEKLEMPEASQDPLPRAEEVSGLLPILLSELHNAESDP